MSKKKHDLLIKFQEISGKAIKKVGNKYYLKLKLVKS